MMSMSSKSNHSGSIEASRQSQKAAESAEDRSQNVVIFGILPGGAVWGVDFNELFSKNGDFVRERCTFEKLIFQSCLRE